MTQRFLAFLLFGVLALTALDGFEQQKEQSATSAAPTDDGEVRVMHGTNGMPPG